MSLRWTIETTLDEAPSNELLEERGTSHLYQH